MEADPQALFPTLAPLLVDFTQHLEWLQPPSDCPWCFSSSSGLAHLRLHLRVFWDLPVVFSFLSPILYVATFAAHLDSHKRLPVRTCEHLSWGVALPCPGSSCGSVRVKGKRAMTSPSVRSTAALLFSITCLHGCSSFSDVSSSRAGTLTTLFTTVEPGLWGTAGIH